MNKERLHTIQYGKLHVMEMMKILLLVVLTFFFKNSFAQDQWKNIYSQPAWAARDKWQKSEEIVRFLHISSGSRVADIGCHEGYMTFKLARAVQSRGTVYAVDVALPKLEKLKDYAETNNIKNIITIQGDYNNPKLPPDILDAVLILDTYHEMDDHDQILQYIKHSLKKGGRILICDPIADIRRKLSRSEQEGKHELAMEFAVADLIHAGFKISYQQDSFIDRTKEKGDKMWVIVGIKE